MKRRFTIRFFSGPLRRVATVQFDDSYADRWSMEDAAHGGTDEHPVAQFRRLSAEALARVDRALVAVHGEPEAQP